MHKVQLNKQELIELAQSLPDDVIIPETMWISELQELVPVVPSITITIVPPSEYDIDLSNFDILEGTELTLKEGDTFDFVSLMKDGEKGSINGEEMLKRSRKLGSNWTLKDGEYIVRNQDALNIKEELKEGYFPLVGTVLQYRVSRLRYVPILGSDGGRLCVRLCYLGSDYSSVGRVPVPRK